MVKVISRTPAVEVVKQVVCKSCGCTLEYVPNDVKKDYDTDYTGSKDYYRYISCPDCNHQVRVK